MADTQGDIPATLGLSDDQIKQLREKFRSDVVEMLHLKDAGDILARAKPQIVRKTQTIQEIIFVD